MTLDKFVISKPSSSEDYKMPTAVYYGRNSALQLPELLNKLPVSNILIVTGSHFQKSDVLSKLSSLVLRSKIIKNGMYFKLFFFFILFENIY